MKPRRYTKLLADGETEESLRQQLDEHQAEKSRWAGSERAAVQWCDRAARLIAELNNMKLRN